MVIVGSRLNEDATRWPPPFFFLGILFIYAVLSMMLVLCRYVLRDDHPYCIKCYENVFANNCDECGKIIGIDSKVTVNKPYYKNSHL